jgi:steroid delta-isomerase-like uncharacterized protein
MDDKQLQSAAKRLLRPRYATQKIGMLIICLGFCFILSPSQAASANVEEQNKAVARSAFLEYLNHEDFKSFEGIHTKDFVKHYNNSPAENLAQEMEDAKGQFISSSDLSFTVNWMIAEGDKVAVCFTAKGTHDGVFQGVPATGRKYDISGMTVWRFADGEIAEEWVFFNDLDLYRQLGLFKDTGQAPH